MAKELTRLPMPDRLEPKGTKRSLATSVRIYFYALYNTTNSKFKTFLASVSNADAVTGNRMFDRYEAVNMIKEEAEHAKDQLTVQAQAGEIYRLLVNLMRENELGLKLRRMEYRRLTATPAE